MLPRSIVGADNGQAGNGSLICRAFSPLECKPKLILDCDKE